MNLPCFLLRWAAEFRLIFTDLPDHPLYSNVARQIPPPRLILLCANHMQVQAVQQKMQIPPVHSLWTGGIIGKHLLPGKEKPEPIGSDYLSLLSAFRNKSGKRGIQMRILPVNHTAAAAKDPQCQGFHTRG